MSTILFQNNWLTIFHNVERDYIYVKWNGFIRGDDFRAAAGEIIKAIRKTKSKSVLSDNTDWETISPNDHGWAAYNWFPEAEASGVRKLATIPSRDYFNRAAEKSIEGMAEVRCMEMKKFNTVGDAEAWLAERKTAANCV